MNLCPKCISLCTLCVLHHLVSATTGGFAEGMKTQINHACIENESKYVFVKIPFLIGSSFRARHTHEQPTQDLWHLRISNLSFESSKVTARVQSNYFPTDIGCRLLPPPQSNISDTTLNYRIETYYNNNDLVPDFIPKNSSNLNQVKEDLFGQFGSFKNVSPKNRIFTEFSQKYFSVGQRFYTKSPFCPSSKFLLARPCWQLSNTFTNFCIGKIFQWCFGWFFNALNTSKYQ